MQVYNLLHFVTLKEYQQPLESNHIQNRYLITDLLNFLKRCSPYIWLTGVELVDPDEQK